MTSKTCIALSALLLIACDVPPPPCGMPDGSWVRHKPTGEVAQVDLYDFTSIAVRLPNGERFSATCDDLEKLP